MINVGYMTFRPIRLLSKQSSFILNYSHLRVIFIER